MCSSGKVRLLPTESTNISVVLKVIHIVYAVIANGIESVGLYTRTGDILARAGGVYLSSAEPKCNCDVEMPSFCLLLTIGQTVSTTGCSTEDHGT